MTSDDASYDEEYEGEEKEEERGEIEELGTYEVRGYLLYGINFVLEFLFS